MIKVFFDASVLFSALYSDKGASRKLLQLVKIHKIIGITTQSVIYELERNILKFKGKTQNQIHAFIIEHKILVRKEVTIDEILPVLQFIEEKDAHVVAGALLTESHYLTTLDKKHLDNPVVIKKIRNLVILPPGKLLKRIR